MFHHRSFCFGGVIHESTDKSQKEPKWAFAEDILNITFKGF